MPVGQVVLLVVAAMLLGFRIVSSIARRRTTQGQPRDDEPTYGEPVLKLDAAPCQPSPPRGERGGTEPLAGEVFGELSSTLAADHAAARRYLEGKQQKTITGDPRVSERFPVSKKMVWMAASLVLLLAAPYAHPSLRFLRVIEGNDADAETPVLQDAVGGPLPSAAIGEAKLPGATLDQEARGKELDAPPQDARGPIARGGKGDAPTSLAPSVKENKPPRPIDDPDKALDRFFGKLARVESKQNGAVARILYFGDSIVASDFVTGKLRRMLHDRFGDAGHGYAIIANAWPGWFHIDVSRKAAEDWLVSTCVGPYAEDGLYGLGCASFTARHKGVWSEIGTATLDRWGRSVARFELEYLKQPGGGAIQLVVDGEPRATIETEAPSAEVAYHALDVPDGPHKLKIVSADERPVRAFGMRMERHVPGVVLSAMGITGARARFMDKQNDAHFARILEASKPDLVCLAFGSNEITDGLKYPIEDYEETLALLMKQIESAVPDAAWMLVGPPDMASNNPAWGMSRPMAHVIAKKQKELAAARRWAFWDQYQAMGGTGSMHSWIQGGLGNQDMFHPTGQGANLLGRWQYLALMEAFEQYKDRHR